MSSLNGIDNLLSEALDNLTAAKTQHELDIIKSNYLGKKGSFTSLLKSIKDKYNELINSSSGKVIKIEEWGLLNLANKIKNYNKGFYIHYKFEGNKNTLSEIEKKIKVDGSIIRYLTVKYKKLDVKNEFFSKSKSK